MFIYLLCLSAALLCYTGFQNQSLIRSTFSPCSTCCFGLGFYNYKTCRNTSKDLGHNSRTSFSQPFLAGLSGCVFFFFFFALLFFLSFFFLFPGFVVPVPPSPFFRAGLVAPFFFFFFFFSVSLFPSVRCYWLGVAGFGWVVPLCLCGVFFFFILPSRGGLGRLWCRWRAVWRPWAVFVPFPLPPSFFFWGGGGGGLACSSICLPWAGARTGLHSVLSSGLLSSVAFCVATFRPHGSGGLCTRWARRPFLLG